MPKSHPVKFTSARGSYPSVCSLCGVIVVDEQLHRDWHDDLNSVLKKIKYLTGAGEPLPYV